MWLLQYGLLELNPTLRPSLPFRSTLQSPAQRAYSLRQHSCIGHAATSRSDANCLKPQPCTQDAQPCQKWIPFASRTRASIAALPIARPDERSAAPLCARFLLSGRAYGSVAFVVSIAFNPFKTYGIDNEPTCMCGKPVCRLPPLAYRQRTRACLKTHELKQR